MTASDLPPQLDSLDSQITALIVEAFEGTSAAVAVFNYSAEDLHLHPHRQSQFSLDHDATLRPT
jgi:hypothetical protein